MPFSAWVAAQMFGTPQPSTQVPPDEAAELEAAIPVDEEQACSPIRDDETARRARALFSSMDGDEED